MPDHARSTSLCDFWDKYFFRSGVLYSFQIAQLTSWKQFKVKILHTQCTTSHYIHSSVHLTWYAAPSAVLSGPCQVTCFLFGPRDDWGIVRLYMVTFDEDSGQYTLVMEFCPSILGESSRSTDPLVYYKQVGFYMSLPLACHHLGG